MKNTAVQKGVTLSSAESFRIPMAVTEIVLFKNGDTYPVCPHCHRSLDREYQRFCDRCGQALNWTTFSKALIVLKL